MFKKLFVSLKKFIKNHKLLAIIIFIVILGLLYLILKPAFAKKSDVSYVTAKVEKGDLISTVSVTGQVIASNSIDIKPKVSGDVTYINLKNGQTVKDGEILLKIDDEDARNNVKDAQIALENAKNTLAKMQGLQTDEGSIQATKEKREKDLTDAYEAAVDGLPNIFSSTTPIIMNNLHDLLYGTDLSSNYYNVDYYAKSLALYNKSAIDYGETTKAAYEVAKETYDKVSADYKSKNLTYFSNQSEIEQMTKSTYEAMKKINDAVRSSLNLVRLYKDSVNDMKLEYPSLIDTHDKTLTDYFNTTNKLFTEIDTLKNNIQTAKENLINVNFDLKDQQDAVDKAQRNLKNYQNKLSDYIVRAPFDGIIGNVDDTILVGDNISANSTAAVLISKKYLIEVNLTEDDAAQVKIGQKAIITFDALSDLQATGKVIDIDIVGTVSQGVVSYNAKILLDNTDERIKSGMSATADIITQTKSGVLTIPRTALKKQNSSYYVEVLNDQKEIEKKPVEIGLQVDSKVEVINGLSEGEEIIISGGSASTSSKKTNSSNTLFNSRNSGQTNNQIRMPGGIF